MNNQSQRTVAAAKVWLLVLLVPGLLGGVWWARQSSKARSAAPRENAETSVAPASGLAAVTREILEQTESGMEIRCYRLVDDFHGAEPLRVFGARLGEMVDEFARVAEQRISVTHYTDVQSRAARAAALADGLEPLRLGRGEPNFLGVVVILRGEKVVLSRLDPKWEEALQFDLTRALARVMGLASPGEVAVNPAPMNAEATAELRRVVPNLEALTLEQARHQVSEAARAEFKLVVADLQQQLAEAQARFAATGDSAASRQELQQLQNQQLEKLNEIPRRTQAQLELLARIKK